MAAFWLLYQVWVSNSPITHSHFCLACVLPGMTAPQAAGVIHSDFEKGFIRAETVSIPEVYICFKSE